MVKRQIAIQILIMQKKDKAGLNILWYKCQKTSKISFEFWTVEKKPTDYIRLNFYYAYLAKTGEENTK